MFEVFALVLLILFQLLLFGALVILVSMSWQAMFGVPWVRTPRRISRGMFKLAGLKKGERVVDFGSGDGSMIIDAVRDFGAQGVGIEGRRDLTLLAKWRAWKNKIGGTAKFIRGNMFEIDFPEADVIAIYLYPETNERLEPLLMKSYPSGTRVVSRTFKFPGLIIIKEQKVDRDTIYLYQIP